MKTTVMMDGLWEIIILLANITEYAIPIYLYCDMHNKETCKYNTGGSGHDIFCTKEYELRREGANFIFFSFLFPPQDL